MRPALGGVCTAPPLPSPETALGRKGLSPPAPRGPRKGFIRRPPSPLPMPAMIVASTCAACGEPRKFIEFKAEPCTPGSEGERRYGFRCLACKTIVEEIVATDGHRHFWSEGKHLEA